MRHIFLLRILSDTLMLKEDTTGMLPPVQRARYTCFSNPCLVGLSKHDDAQGSQQSKQFLLYNRRSAEACVIQLNV